MKLTKMKKVYLGSLAAVMCVSLCCVATLFGNTEQNELDVSQDQNCVSQAESVVPQDQNCVSQVDESVVPQDQNCVSQVDESVVSQDQNIADKNVTKLEGPGDGDKADAKVTEITKEHIVLTTVSSDGNGNVANYENNDYLTEDFIDINGNYEEKVSVFGQKIDGIQYVEYGLFSNEPYFRFDTETAPSVKVKIYDSNNKDATMVARVINKGAHEGGDQLDYTSYSDVRVYKGVNYNTMEFEPYDYARVTEITSDHVTLKINPASYTNASYISMNFIDINGKEEDEVSMFGQQIDYIQFVCNLESSGGGAKPQWYFDSETDNKIKVKLIDSAAQRSVEGTLYNGFGGGEYYIDVPGNLYIDTIEFGRI